METEIRNATWWDMVLLAVGRRTGVEVTGDSMLPTLAAGDRVLIDTHAAVHPGDIVLAQHPYKQSTRIIKRVRSIDANGAYFLTGDNKAETTDSTTFGPVPPANILGKATSVIDGARTPLSATPVPPASNLDDTDKSGHIPNIKRASASSPSQPVD